MTEIEKVKAQIKVLEKKLSFLEELEKTKTPCEEGYKKVFGYYPVTDVGDAYWEYFQKGYEQAQKDYKVGEYQETAQERGERVHKEMEEIIKIHDGYGVVDYKPTPQTPAEEAYKRWMDVYPPTGPSVNAIDLFRWRAFQRGYDAAYQEPEENEWKSVALKLGEKLSDVGPDGYYEFSADEWFEWVIDECLTNEVKRLQEKEWNAVRESVKWCEEHPDKDPLDWLKPQTPEQVADGLKEAFREAVKQGVVSSTTKPKTLYQLIEDWWSDVFTTHSDWDMETSIANLVDEISLWLPTEHETNSYKWNECIRMIREKLR
jgi:hypothetical protein